MQPDCRLPSTAAQEVRVDKLDCPLALHCDLEGGNPASITNMTLGAGLVHAVLVKHGLAGRVGLHFDTFNEWSYEQSTRLGNTTVSNAAFPCPWHDGSQLISINECLLRANDPATCRGLPHGC